MPLEGCFGRPKVVAFNNPEQGKCDYLIRNPTFIALGPVSTLITNVL